MLTLDILVEPYWLDLPRGVRVEIRPVTTAVMAAAQAAASRRLGAIRAADNGLDPDMARGLAFALLVKALARHAVTAWEGVGDAAGQPLPLSKRCPKPGRTASFGRRLRFGIVLADAGYGMSAGFRRGLGQRGQRWALGIPRNPKVYSPGVQLVAPSGRKRRLVPDKEPRLAEAVLAELRWRRIAWRQGSKGLLTAQFAATRVRVGDGATWANNRHLPGDEVWPVGEWNPE
jgi:hypothetical protein